MASSSTALSSNQVSELQISGDYAIKSEAVTPKLGASILRGFGFALANPRYLAMALVAEELRQIACPIFALHPDPISTSTL